MAETKSLYVVSFDRYLRAFKLEGARLVFKAQIPIPPHGSGVVDVAIDDETGVIFISHEEISHEERGNIIEIYNTSLCHIGTVELDGPSDIAGLVFDKANSRLIASERNNNKIWLGLMRLKT
jgi:hypothetical protein